MPYIDQLKAEPSHRIYGTDRTMYINCLYYTGHFFTMQWLDVQQVASQLQSNWWHLFSTAQSYIKTILCKL